MIGPENEVDLVGIGEAPWYQREQLAHRLLRLLSLASRRVVKMVEGGVRLAVMRSSLQCREIAPMLCVLRDALCERSSG
jgi:hypothetical protein